ncbi:MAG: hypothetical protein WCF12_12865 [Propionicimonas sp.]
MTNLANGYCVTLKAGVVCAYRAPALITVTSTAAGVTRHSDAANYFSGFAMGPIRAGERLLRGGGNALYRQVTRLNRGVSNAKDDFLSIWNTQIAPAHDAPTFSRSQI